METKNLSSFNDVWFIVFCDDSQTDSVLNLLSCLDSFLVKSFDKEIIPEEKLFKTLIVFRCSFKDASKVAGVFQSLNAFKWLVYNKDNE